nr:diacylglycerol kinase family lipid kinase [Candidatus Sigynarchaeota archaeon]
MQNYAFIINPHSAGGKTKKKWDSLLEPALKAKNVDYKVFFTERREHAIQLARDAAQSGGFKNVVSVGGDGTFHEVVNGVLDKNGKLVKPGTNVGVICSGTGSDFIKTIGIPQDPLAAIDLALKGNVRTIDVLKGTFQSVDGQQMSKFSINVADAGVGGDVVALVNRSRKIFGGKVTFQLAILRTFLSYKLKPVRVELDSETPRDIELVSIFFGNCIYNGGGLKAAYKAVPDDGLMDVFIIHGIKQKNVLAANMKELYKDDAAIEALMKKFPSNMSYGRYKKAKLIPAGTKDVMLDFDGEMVGKGPLDIEIIPSAVNVLAP